MNTRAYILAIYMVTPVLLWPVVFLRGLALLRLMKRLKAEGYTGVGVDWDPVALRFIILRMDKPDAPQPFAVTPRMEFVYALAGEMPETLWALTFNCVPLFRDMTRGVVDVRPSPFALLEPG